MAIDMHRTRIPQIRQNKHAITTLYVRFDIVKPFIADHIVSLMAYQLLNN